MDASSKKPKTLGPAEHLDGDGGEMSARSALILLADDDADSRAEVRRLLGERYTVEAVADGQAALVAARARMPDLVLIGELQSGFDGYDLLRELRSDLHTKTVPVIFLSAGDDEDSRVAGLEAGAEDYLVRPFKARELLTRVQTSLEMARGRRETEEQLRHSEERFRAIVSQATAGIAQVDLTGKFTLVNDRYCEISGYSREELLTLRMQEMTHPEDLPANLEQFERLLYEGTPFVIEKRYVRRDGSHVWVSNSVSLIRDAAGRPHSVLAVTLDITKRRQAEAALRRTQARLEAALEAGLAGTFYWDIARDRIMTDENMLRYFSLSEQALQEGVPLEEVLPSIHDEDRASVVRALTEAMEQSGVYAIEYRVNHSDKRTRWLSARGAVERDAAGAVIGLPGFAVDITDRKEAEAALRASEERYRTLFNSIDQGFCVCEMLFDENGEPADYRFLEVNPVFEKMTGLVQATGRTARKLVPQLEKKWFEIYGRVVLTGEPVRFRDGAKPMNRWFDVYAFRVGPSGDRRFAVLFNDITERKKFEEERERFLAVGSDLQVITGTNGYFKWVSPAFERTLGWSFEEMISRPWTDFTHPDDVGKSVTETDSLFSGNETFAFENRYRHKDGSYRWFLWNAQPYLKENVIYGAAVDITERKRNEQALRESEARFRNMADYAPVMIWITDADAACTYLSQSWYEFTGQTPETGLGLGWLEATHPDDRAPSEKIFLAANEKREFFRLEYRLRRKDGTYRWAIDSAQPRFGADGEFLGYIGSVIDISERKEAEEKIRESEEKFRDLANSISQFAWMADAEGYIFWYNERWFDYTGTTLEEMQGWGWQAVHHPDEVERVTKRFKQSITSGEPWEDTFPLRSKTGEYRWFLSRALPIRDEQGRVVRWFGTNTDVEELRQARKTAEEANRLKDEFLATVSHELRTPLTAIIGWTHLLRAEQLDAAGAARALETVERNALAQRQLVEDLLDVSRIITGKLRLDLQPCAPASFIEAAIEAVRPAAEAKGVRLQKILDTGVGAISGDAGRLQQVVWNLLTNAIRHTPRGGRVQVLLERVNSHVEIIVTDTGVGIPVEFLPHVFDRFRQADGSTTRAHGGLGLGLAIVRHLVELHGGEVSADSHGEGQGATFTVKLPLLPIYRRRDDAERRVHPAAANDSHPAIEDTERLDDLRILVVDDERDTGEMLETLLARFGAEVKIATSAQAALALLEEMRFDLLISDIGMPGVDGYELIRGVRRLPAGSGGHTPAIALTAYARTEDRLRALRAGYQMHVPKPVDLAELIAVISSLVKRSREN